MSRIFIDRPIFAWVLAIIVMLAGIGALNFLPNEQYPDIAPTQVNIRAGYQGASAQTIENSVTQIIEQQLTGIDGLLYFSSSSSNRGQANISVVFAKGTDPDIAQVQVQNKVQSALPRLPQTVQAQGVTVTKSNPDQLLTVAVYDETGTRSNQDVSDYLTSNIQDTLSRVEGVGDVDVFGAPHAMRIWLDPGKLAAVSLMPSDVTAAIQAQNTEVAAGEIGGQPSPEGQPINAIVTAGSRFQTEEQFRDIVIKNNVDGSAVTIKDVGRVEIGAQAYNMISRVNGYPGAAVSISLAPGADALRTAEAIKAKVEELSKQMPDGIKYFYGNDSTDFIKLSVDEVEKSLIEAIILVIIVMFVFLQSWRATLIPTIAVPVVLLGTFAVFYVAGFSINTMTLFGLVLAIGLLVDDAIVVVENVERLLEENPEMTPREATIQSMEEIQVALIAIALVLSAVFLPMAFFGGSTGVIYRQFALTIVTAMIWSVLVALVLSPALTATLLKQKHAPEDRKPNWLEQKLPWLAGGWEKFHVWFNSSFERMTDKYVKMVHKIIIQKWRWLVLFVIACVGTFVMFDRLPTGFIPNEDQGNLMVQWRLPAGTPRHKTEEVQHLVETYFQTHEKDNIRGMFAISGGGPGSSGQNSGSSFINLAHWSQRTSKENSAAAIAQRATAAFRNIRDAQVFVMVPGAIRGLGSSSGFTMELQNANGLSAEKFAEARDQLLDATQGNSNLDSVRLSNLPDVSTLKINTDIRALTAFGLSTSNVNSTLSTAWGGAYVNDFIDKGRVKRVYVQGDAPFRSQPEDLSQWFVRGSNGQMVPFSAFSNIEWSTAPSSTSRFNGLPAYEFSGQAAPGVSSGTAMQTMEKLVADIPGVSVAWAGSSYQERLSSGQGPVLYGLALLVVFLCLAALYESWSIPVAVILVIPLGLLGAVAFVTLRGLENDIYLQIGLLTTMGLAAKNAILMIEFAEQAERQGKRVIDAAIEAAKMRLRPILMTSFAFIFGVLPLALANGAGANSRIAIGTAVIGGMLTATLLAIFYIPLFFVLVRRGVREGLVVLRDLRQARRQNQGEGA